MSSAMIPPDASSSTSTPGPERPRSTTEINNPFRVPASLTPCVLPCCRECCLGSPRSKMMLVC